MSDARGGGRRLTILRALDRLAQFDIDITDTSSFYECVPYPKRAMPVSIRLCAEISTDLSCEELQQACIDVEYSLGKSRSDIDGPRMIDIVLLDYKGEIKPFKDTKPPYDTLKKRADFLLPLGEIAPKWRHPTSGKMIEEIIDKVPLRQRQHVKKISKGGK